MFVQKQVITVLASFLFSWACAKIKFVDVYAFSTFCVNNCLDLFGVDAGQIMNYILFMFPNHWLLARYKLLLNCDFVLNVSSE